MARWTIDDPADPRLVEFLGLRDHELRRRREQPGGDMEGVFVAEGDPVVSRALRAGYRLRALLVDAARRDPLPAAIAEDVPVYLAGPVVLQRITGYHTHRGILGSFARRPLPRPSDVVATARRVVVCEGVVNPTNLGVIVRSAAALGWDAILLDPTSCDPLYRRASRVAMGEGFAVPHARLPRLPGGLAILRDAGFRTVALTPDPAAVAVDAVSFEPGERLAVMFGSEAPGLTPGSIGEADLAVRIPMRNGVDSLNVGAAAAIACYALAPRAHGRV